MIFFIFITARSSAQVHLHIQFVDKDTFFTSPVKFQSDFADRQTCIGYIKKIPSLLNGHGYGNASVDSVWFENNNVSMYLYVGKKQQTLYLNTDSVEKKALESTGFSTKRFRISLSDFSLLPAFQKRLLNYYENNGYPFAAVSLSGIAFHADTMFAKLNVEKGTLYHIDSIRIYGKLKLSNNFLQHYLDISDNSYYRKDRLDGVSKKLSELPYLQEVQPWDMTMLGTGSVLNLYLNTKKSSQMNFLVGFQPSGSASSKLRLTGEANIDLQNAFGVGESILLNWQQLQYRSPRLAIGYRHPYIFNSTFGADFHFNLFKKDSSFMQLNTQLGITYLLTANRSGKIFFNNQSSFLLESGVDTIRIKLTKKLPDNIDYNALSMGLEYEFTNTNYKFNPRSGNELSITTSIGIKKIKKNSSVLNIKDVSFDYGSLYDSVKLRSYQLRIKAAGSHYFPVGKQSVVKTTFSGGVFSSTNIFRNELFQIGGFRLLRGFDEESIYATQYGVASLEYRFLSGLNSYFFSFIDAGWVKSKYQQTDLSNNFISAGAGMVFETKLGLLNLNYAVGRRNDIKTNLSNASKIHFGYINYF